jgi:hypothetical protein
MQILRRWARFFAKSYVWQLGEHLLGTPARERKGISLKRDV